MQIVLVLFALTFQEFDSPNPSVARSAVEAAIRKGDEAALEAAARTSRGARYALAELRAHKRFGDAYPMPRKVTLKATGRPAAEVVERLSQAIGMKVEVKDLNLLEEKKVSVDLVDAPLLEAVDVLGREIDREPEVLKDQILFSDSPFKPLGPVFYARNARFTISGYSEFRDLLASEGRGVTSTLWGGGETQGLIRLAGDRGERLDEVVDDAGRLVIPEPADDKRCYWADGGGGFQFGMALKVPPEASARRISIRGAWRVLLPEGPRFDELPLDDPSRTLSTENMSFQIAAVSDNRASVSVTVRVMDRKKEHVRPTPADFRLVAGNGKAVPAEGGIQGPEDRLVLELSFKVPEDFEPVTLRVRHFKSLGDHEIPFEFKDLPIR